MQLLMIEDDQDLCRMLQQHFNTHHFTIDFCHTGEDAMFYILKQTYDLIILDRMLPHKDGLSILAEMRHNHITTPVIMLTAMGTLENRIEGLDRGADDYLIKPFEIGELFARIRALLRRPTPLVHSDILCYSNIQLNILENKLYSPTNTCALSKRETDLLAFFMRNKGQILTRDMLLTRVWGADSFVMDSNLDNFICFLRKRLHYVGSLATLTTIRSVGYKLEDKTCHL
ncbi:MAG: response regulator transcription factor [Cellulosilyticaceae bacterium]